MIPNMNVILSGFRRTTNFELFSNFFFFIKYCQHLSVFPRLRSLKIAEVKNVLLRLNLALPYLFISNIDYKILKTFRSVNVYVSFSVFSLILMYIVGILYLINFCIQLPTKWQP